MRFNQKRQKIWVLIATSLILTMFTSPFNINAQAQTEELTASFDYSMPERFGMDTDKDGLIDYYTEEEDINPGKWRVDFDACSSTGSPSLYRWSVNNETLESNTCDGFFYEFENEGVYLVGLEVNEVTDTRSSSAATLQYVVVQDWLIIGLGDSYGSGEGNPDIPADIGKPAVWQDDGCNRSAFSGQTQAAIKLEEADNRTSVTFVHLACSGNVINDLTKNGGQLDKMTDLIGDRTVDAIIVSIGGNDINFSEIVKACMYQSRCNEDNLVDPNPGAIALCLGVTNPVRCIDFFEWEETRRSGNDLYTAGLGTLDNSYSNLDASLTKKFEESPLPLNRIFITEYPDITHDSGGYICGFTIFDEPDHPIGPDNRTSSFTTLPGWSYGEGKWASDTVLPALNGKIKAAASLYGWKYITGIAAGFKNHGYCSLTDSKKGYSRWIVTLEDSIARQGDPYGGVHPNKEGHIFLKEKIYNALVQELYVNGDLSRPKQIPLAQISIDSTTIEEGDSTSVVNQTINLNGDDLEITWSSNSPTKVALRNNNDINHRSVSGIDNGTAKITLTATNSWGSSSTSVLVTIENVKPIISLGEQAASAEEGSPYSLSLGTVTDPGDDTVTEYIVNWGDGNIDTYTSAGDKTHIYTDGNNNITHTITVDLKDEDGTHEVAGSKVVSVNNAAPEAVINNDGPIIEGSSVTVSLSDALDSSSDDIQAGFHYAFDCSGGSLAAATYAGSSTSNTHDCTFADNGSYVVRGKIMDKDNGATEYTTTVNVNNSAPTASISNSSPIIEGSSVTISLSDALDSSNDDTQAGFHYAFDCSGGSLAAATYADSGTSNTHDCTFADNGSYVVRGKIIDKDDGATEYTTIVKVNNVAPQITASSTTINENETATISGTIQDPGSQDNFTLEVDWGEGNPETITLPAGSTSYSVNHQYLDDNPSGSESDEYTVQVTLTDKDRDEGLAAATVTVNNVDPTANPVVDGDPVEGTTVNLRGDFNDPGADTHTFKWVFINSSNNQVIPGTTNQDLAFTPIDNGTYTFDFEVTDDDGGKSETVRLDVTVDNAVPVITANSTIINENETTTINGTIKDLGILDDFTLKVNWGEGETETITLPPGSTSYSVSHHYLDDNPTGSSSDDYSVQISLTDKDGGESFTTPTVTVNNLNPDVEFKFFKDEAGRVLSWYEVIPVNTTLNVVENYSDYGPSDTRTAVRNWGDGFVIELGNVEDTTSGSHIYTKVGYYQLVLTVTDDDGGVATVKRTIHVVHPAGAVENTIERYISSAGANRRAALELEDAIQALDGDHGAVIKIERGNPYGAMLSIEQAMRNIKYAQNKDPNMDTSSSKIQLALTAQSILIDAISQAEKKAKNQKQRNKIEEAKMFLEEGKKLIAAGDYYQAVILFRKGLNRVRPR